MIGIELLLFGRFAVRGPEGPIPLASRKLAGLLAVLAVSPAADRTREALQGLLWGSHFDEQARQSLRQALARLRRSIGTEAIVADDQILGLQAELVVSDARRMEELAGRDDRESLAAAAQLYRGPFLADVTIREERWDEWLAERRRHYESLAVDAMVRLADLEYQAGHSDDCRRHAEAAIAIDPFREDAHRLAIKALAALGRRADAVRHFAELTEMLDRELGTKPDPTTASLVSGLSQASERAASPVTGASAAAVPSERSIAEAFGDSVSNLAIRSASGDRTILQRVAQHIESSANADAISKVRQSRDVLVVETTSAVAAARMALDLQASLQLTDAETKQHGHIAIGFDVGARHARSGEASDAKAVALASMAPDGRILTSEDARDHLVDGLDGVLHDLGVINQPGTSERSRVFALAAPELGISLPHPSLRLAPTLGVLPVWAAHDADQRGTLGDLLADEVIGFISQSKYIDVVSSLSTRALARRELPISHIAAHLGCDYVVSGSIAPPNGRSQVAIELIDARSGIVRWRGSSACDLSRPEAVREAAQWVALEVTAAIYTTESHRAAARPLASLDSYTLLFAAISLMDRWTFTGFQRAGELLHTLHERAPLHAVPNAWLAAWHIRSISQGWTADGRADGRKASDFARRALDSDPFNSVALTMDGWAEVYGHSRLDLASEKLAFAVEANPNDCLAWLLKGVTHAFKGEGALASPAVQRALRLAPLDPRRSYYESMSATAEMAAGNYDRAIELGRNSFRANRMHASTLRAIALSQWWSGREDEARETIRQHMAMAPAFTVSGYLRYHPVAASEFGRTVAEALRAAGVPD